SNSCDSFDFFFSSRRRHTRSKRDWSSDVCSSDLAHFELSPEDVNLLENWVHAAGIRWGLSGQQRASLQVPNVEPNTWLFGLRRMLAGYLVGDEAVWQGIAPYGEVAGLDARLAGQLAHLLDMLNHYWQQFTAKHTPDAWGELFGRLLDDFFEPQEEGENTLNAS